MTAVLKYVVFLKLLFGTLHLSVSNAAYHDPHRWIPSHGKPVTQSSTDGSHVASYATDGDYNHHVEVGIPLNYSKTTISDNPYLQVDIGRTILVLYIVLVFPVFTNPAETYTNIRVTLGPDAVVGSSANTILEDGKSFSEQYLITTKTWGRYLTVQRMETNTQLSLTEVAIHDIPVENIAYKRNSYATTSSTNTWKALDMNYNKLYTSNVVDRPFLEVNFGDIDFIHEVLLATAASCCRATKVFNFEIRIGNENSKNSNLICASRQMFLGEMRSFYCDMFGRYLYLIAAGTGVIQVAEVIVNPETTVNVARNATAVSDVPVLYATARSVDQLVKGHCYLQRWFTQAQVRLDLIADYKVACIHIVFPVQYSDLEIRVGMTNDFSTASNCVPGLQTTSGHPETSFFCEPRLTGRHVFIKHYETSRRLSICEVAIFEETKPKFIDTGKYVWTEENKDVTLFCDVKGYPPPIVSWVKDRRVIESNSNSLQLLGVRFNQSGFYECWANNTHGTDATWYKVRFTNKLRVCAEPVELKYVVGVSTVIDAEIRGTKWYRIFDPKGMKFLQFRQSAPSSILSCRVWLNGDHPKLNNGVVSRTLCVKNETNECATTMDIYIRRCATHYIYNFKGLQSTAGLKFCFTNEPRGLEKINPAIVYPIKNHALLKNVLQTETEIEESHCLLICQLEQRCKSFNFSKKLAKCELNSASKKEFPENLAHNTDYDYYHMGKGIVMSVKQEL